MILKLRCCHSNLFDSNIEFITRGSNLIVLLEAAQTLCVSSGPRLIISFY